jgi:hypothetical protein
MEHDEQLNEQIKEKIDQLSPKGSLFDSITYYNEIHLDEFLNGMNKDQAIYCLIEAAKSSYRRGAFKLDESEAISKALRVLGAQ